jgi:hypothetical protein
MPMKASLCTDTRKDGSPCNSYAREDGLCAWHSRQRDEQETLRELATSPAIVETEQVEEEELSRAVDNVRAELARDVGEHYGGHRGWPLRGAQSKQDRVYNLPELRQAPSHRRPGLDSEGKGARGATELGLRPAER